MKTNKNFSLKNRFTPTVGKGNTKTSGYWFIFSEDKLLIRFNSEKLYAQTPFAPDSLNLEPDFSMLFGHYSGLPCFLATVHSRELPAEMKAMNLRSLFGAVDEDYFSLAGRALQILHHTREHIYCSKCATPMEDREGELARKCPKCNFISFPRVSPAVIMSVVRDDHILLGRSPHFIEGMYSTLAGFVEAGETLEEAVCREVYEETSITIEDVQYVTSQPWPFPHSVMIGFSARYLSGKIQIDKTELEDAGWFHYKELPKLPSKITIARLLIDNFVESCKKRYDT